MPQLPTRDEDLLPMDVRSGRRDRHYNEIWGVARVWAANALARYQPYRARQGDLPEGAPIGEPRVGNRGIRLLQKSGREPKEQNLGTDYQSVLETRRGS